LTGDERARQVTDVAEMIYRRADQLAVELARAIIAVVPRCGSPALVSFDVVTDGCAANLRAILAAVSADSEFDTTAATEVGLKRAGDGVPLSSVMDAFRVGFRGLWEAVDAEASRRHTTAEARGVLTAKLFSAQDVYTAAMAAGYRQEQTRRARREEVERSALIDGLLHGHLFEQWSLWEVADCLRLPSRGPFVVIAARLPTARVDALAGIESKLRSVDVFSAWRRLPDLQVGIVHVSSDKRLADVLALVSRTATTRVGVSPRFNSLRETAQALRYARVTLEGRSHTSSLVSIFDGSILASAAVSAPEVMVKLVTPTMECFAELPDNERDVLFDTFWAWLEHNGSLRAVSEQMFCHPNTVRYRLHRIEQRTGRSLSRPRDVAELCLAFEVHRRLM
jgi:hypothetical protein